jgi:hypothetical protein
MDCPVHGTVEHVLTGQQMKETFDPAPPLHVRVAKALGKKITRCIPTDPKNYYWGYDSGERGIGRYLMIPPYDEDVKLAIGALEEYCREAMGYSWSISCNTESDYYEIRIADKEYGPVKGFARAICEAICAHAEQQ